MIGIPWQLGQWRVFEVQLPGRPDRTRHFAGYSLALRVPKITGPITRFEPLQRRGTDSSNNVFALIGVSRANSGIGHAWDEWVQRNQALAVRDVSRDVSKVLVLYPGSWMFDGQRAAEAVQ